MSRLLKLFQTRNYSKSNNNLLNLLKTMPKEPKHILEAQKQRRKIKERLNKYSPSRVTLQVLGTGGKGAPTCLYIFTDQSRYLFNCGEGTQRLAHEHKMRLSKLEHIFITRPVWQNIGGLPGAALTIQDVGVPEITLHGPAGLEEIFVATRRFIILKDLDIKIAKCDEDTVFQDNVIKVRYVPIQPTSASLDVPIPKNDDFIIDETDYYAHESSGRRKVPQQISGNSKLFMEQPKVSMCYICQLQPRPGALCLEKCVKFGVPPGPLLGQLKSGQDITLKDGTIVKATDVCDPDDPGPVFIIIDCPSQSYLDALVTNKQLENYQNTPTTKDDHVPYLFVHFTPQQILNDPKYQDWLNKFSPSTQHLVLNEQNTCMGSLAVHRIQYKLNLLSNNIFPLLGDKGTEIIDEKHLPEPKKIKTEQQFCGNSIMGTENDTFLYPNTLYNHHLRPKKGIDRSLELKLIPSEYVEETMLIETFPETLQQVKQIMEEKSILPVKEYPKFLFLGTGSSIPNKTRNTSAILYELNECNKILMDCSEGTYGQIVRFYGLKKCDEILKNLKAIYISHLHADHHLGLIGVLLGRKKAFNNLNVVPNDGEKLILFAPKQIQWWLEFYDKCFEKISDQYELIANSDLLFNKPQLTKDVENSISHRLEMNEIKTCYVRHCANAFGVSFIDKINNQKIVYSGDTMPCNNLIELGLNCDLLIHEATMEDDLKSEACIKMHSTTSQAIEIAKKMNAKYVLLTHFSQRYAKLPRFNDNFADNVGIAFDNMQIRMDELILLPNLYPALKLMFAEHYEDMENKAIKRQLRLEREKELLVQMSGKQ